VDFAGLSATGPVRTENQDAILVPETTLPGTPHFLAALADGMGGYAWGDVASKLAISVFQQTLIDLRGETLEKSMRRAIELANLQVLKTGRELEVGRMGTTLTCACIAGDQLYIAHLGDSRAYLFHQDRLQCLTNDHTLVGDMLRARVIGPDKVRTHEQRSILTKAVGLEIFVNADISRHKLAAGDRLILCSDGLWSVIEDHEIAQLASAGQSTQALAQDLLDLSLSRASDDNCSVVVADIRMVRSNPASTQQTTRRGWLGFFER
jgi:protein phosphatase